MCRSSAVDRFMIGCDHCEEWYHGNCINVGQKEAKYIKKFFCKECREKNPHLAVVYKSKYADKLKEEEEELAKKNFLANAQELLGKKEPKEKKRDKEHHKDRHKDKHRDRDHDHDREKKEKKSKDKKKERDRSRSRSKEKQKEKREVGRPYDKHAHKRHKEKDKEREKPTVLKEEPKEEKKANVVEQLVEHKPVKEEPVKEEPCRENAKEEEGEKEPSKAELSQARRMEELMRERSDSIETLTPPRPKPGEARKVERQETVVNLSSSSSESCPVVAVVAAAPRPVVKPAATATKRKASKDQRDREVRRKRSWREADYSSEDEEEADLAPRQCHGLECTNCARVGSKYCSDQCGLSLASLRIYQTLPERIREWNSTPCKSSEATRGNLVRIWSEIEVVRGRLEEVDRQVVALEGVIAKSRTVIGASESNSQDSSDEEDEQRGTQVNCVSCGKDVPSRTAIRHMESCFNKFESQTSFGSMYKTRIDGYEMFCDFYNPDTETYCKRLRVICPEHTKDKGYSDTDPCGAPLVRNLFKQTGDRCRKLKIDCSAHYCWEKLRRAELDMDRVRHFIKLDELMEKERSEKELLAGRAGVLNLMLHSTFNHELMERMMAQQALAKQLPQQKAKRA